MVVFRSFGRARIRTSPNLRRDRTYRRCPRGRLDGSRFSADSGSNASDQTGDGGGDAGGGRGSTGGASSGASGGVAIHVDTADASTYDIWHC